MNSQLSIGNLVTVGDMKFHDIEGGFGKNKRAMLVKEIAEIHSRPLFKINELINNNRKRFVDGKDIIDLLGIRLTDTEIQAFGFTQQAINSYRGLKAKGKTAGIYVLSERGYSKLLKIMDDDLAWEKYDQLVDGYFQMRQVIKESPEALESAKRIRAEAMLLNAKTRAFKTVKAVKNDAKLSDVAAELYGLSTLENLLGSRLGHAPEVGKLYTASEVANAIGNGCTAQKVGRVAKANNLQTDQFGIWALDKSPYSAKQVNSFRYNEQGKAKLKALFGA